MLSKISVIIVNYNVCYFLEQTLKSVYQAIGNLSIEIFVVDNASVDGSVEMVKKKFPDVILIESVQNLGFSKANNLAIRQAKGEYILLLNPDTVVQKDTFSVCCSYMDANLEAGGLGVYMVDGKGDFLPESKRGLPTPWVAFYKISGLSSLFPKSKKYGKYHLGFLDKNKTHQIDVLSGAFMFMRKSVLDNIGLLDEDYFMYGEDIDLSYRITKAGFKNIYLPDTKIIHYKGESTKKSSLNYVYIFYGAMAIFAKKHFSSSYARSFSILIHIAIWAKAILSFLQNTIKKYAHVFLDTVLVLFGTIFIKNYWQDNFKYVGSDIHYPSDFSTVVIPIYTLVWIFCVYISGGYYKPYKSHRIIRGVVLGAVIISSVTNFVDAYRYSKAIIILASFWTIIALLFSRLFINFIKYKKINFEEIITKKIIIIGSFSESNRVIDLLNQTKNQLTILGFISTETYETSHENYLGNYKNTAEILKIYKPNEVIFCSKNMPAHDIISMMANVDNSAIEYKIVPDDSNFIIGSHSKESQGELYTFDIELKLINPINQRSKRLIDILFSLFGLIFAPFLILIQQNKKNYFKNMFSVLLGNYSFIGFSTHNSAKLPKIKNGVLNPASEFGVLNIDEKTREKLDILYAKNYKPADDINIILNGIRKLG
ncbi:MAG: glycosyltransferase [Bacteroidetes bacterium]|nr:MAG: glycosyltransferase [Bacteroidota bacterium]